MENVMLQQFENYLISEKLIVEHGANSNQSYNSNTTVPKTFDNLTAEEVNGQVNQKIRKVSLYQLYFFN